MNPRTGIPSFVLSYEKDHIKFYPNFSKYLSKFYDFNPNKDPRRFADAVNEGSASGDYYGKFKEDVVNNIILQEHPMRIDLRKLPEDVEMIVNKGDDDDDVDDDRGGGRLATLRRTLDKWRRYQYELYEGGGEEEESDKEPSEALIMGGPKDEPHDDDDEAFVTPPQSNKDSDEFRLEFPKLESDKEELIKELESKKAEAQKVKDYNQELTLKLKKLQEEIDIMRVMENSRKDDYVYLEEVCEEQKKEIVELGLGKRELETRLQELKEEHKRKAHELKTGYDMTIKEMSEDIKGLQAGVHMLQHILKYNIVQNIAQ